MLLDQHRLCVPKWFKKVWYATLKSTLLLSRNHKLNLIRKLPEHTISNLISKQPFGSILENKHTGFTEFVVQRTLFWSANLSHELIGDGLQELRLVVLGADEVCWPWSSRLEENEMKTSATNAMKVSM